MTMIIVINVTSLKTSGTRPRQHGSQAPRWLQSPLGLRGPTEPRGEGERLRPGRRWEGCFGEPGVWAEAGGAAPPSRGMRLCWWGLTIQTGGHRPQGVGAFLHVHQQLLSWLNVLNDFVIDLG